MIRGWKSGNVLNCFDPMQRGVVRAPRRHMASEGNVKPLNARNVLGVCLKSAHENWLSLPAPYTDAGVLSDIECDLEHALKAVRQLQQGDQCLPQCR